MKKKIFILISVVIILLVFSGILILPVFIEHSIIPQLANSGYVERIGCRIGKIGFHKLGVSNLFIGDTGNNLLSVNKLNINYSPYRLINKHIDSIALNGVNLNIYYEDGKWILPGINIGKNNKPLQKEQSKLKTEIPLSIGKIVIENGLLNIIYDGKKYRIPFSLVLKNIDKDLSNVKGYIELVLRIKENNDKIVELPAKFSISLASCEDGSFKFNINKCHLNDFDRIKFYGCDINFNTRELSISGVVKKSAEIAFKLNFPGFSLSSKEGKIEAEEIAAEGALNVINEGSKPKINVILKSNIENLKIHRDKNLFDIKNISFNLPFQWPYADMGKKGFLQIESIILNKLRLGCLVGRVEQYDKGFRSCAEFKCDIFKELNLILENSLFINNEAGIVCELDYSVKNYNITSLDKVKELYPVLAQYDLSGILNLKGHADFKKGKLFSCLSIEMNNADLSIPDKDLSVAGINFKLVFPDTNIIKSAPKQEFSFEKLKFKNFSVENGITYFQIESLNSFFIENGKYKWCDGYVYFQPLRIIPGKSDYSIVLFCDRIKLAKLLEQVGVCKAEGNGMLSGKVPVLMDKEGIFFEDGVLYSFPGVKGIIRLSNTEMITAGLPKTSPQYHQLELARQALTYFKYDWCRLSFNSINENCNIKLTLKGKPVLPLSFKYDEDLKQYTEIPKGGDSVQLPMIIDLNFSIPVNQFIQYGMGINKIIDDFSK